MAQEILIRQQEQQGHYILPFSADKADVFQTKWQKGTLADDMHVDTMSPKKRNVIKKNSLKGAAFCNLQLQGHFSHKVEPLPCNICSTSFTPRKKDLNPMGHHAIKKCVNRAVHHRNMWSVAGVEDLPH